MVRINMTWDSFLGIGYLPLMCLDCPTTFQLLNNYIVKNDWSLHMTPKNII